MADMYAVSGETLTGIADAIRSKTGSDEQMTVAAMADAIQRIPTGGSTPEIDWDNPINFGSIDISNGVVTTLDLQGYIFFRSSYYGSSTIIPHPGNNRVYVSVSGYNGSTRVYANFYISSSGIEGAYVSSSYARLMTLYGYKYKE